MKFCRCRLQPCTFDVDSALCMLSMVAYVFVFDIYHIYPYCRELNYLTDAMQHKRHNYINLDPCLVSVRS